MRFPFILATFAIARTFNAALSVAVLCVLTLAVESAKADTISDGTIDFIEHGDTLEIIGTGGVPFFLIKATGEQGIWEFSPVPVPATFVPTAGVGSVLLVGEASGKFVSDEIDFSVQQNGAPILTFLSDSDQGQSPCPMSGCSLTENGTLQTAGTLTLTFPGEIFVETIRFQSDVETVPEASSLILLSTGLVGVIHALRRKLLA